MLLTVVVCTWNRAELLDQTLAQMQRLRIPAGTSWELLVVNNACTDHTGDVLARHAGRLPLRPLFEARSGLSHARNAAVEAASGDVIAFTDDDVLVEPDWLDAYAAAARRWPHAVYFGGRILPWYQRPAPRWVTENLDLLKGMLVLRDLGESPCPFPGEEAPFGANMAFRRGVFPRCRFDPHLGVVAGQRMLGEETALIARLRAEGGLGIWVPAAIVRHFVPAARMTRRYLWQWAFGWGRSLVRMGEETRGRTWRSRFRLRLDQLRQAARYVQRRAVGREDWVRAYYAWAEISGILAERDVPPPAPQPGMESVE